MRISRGRQTRTFLGEANDMKSVQIIRKSSVSSLNSDESEKLFEQIVKKSTKPEKPPNKPSLQSRRKRAVAEERLAPSSADTIEQRIRNC